MGQRQTEPVAGEPAPAPLSVDDAIATYLAAIRDIFLRQAQQLPQVPEPLRRRAPVFDLCTHARDYEQY